MERVGVRELRQNASRVLARVKAGETVEITERGRPVARLTPLGEGDAYARLIEAGDVLPGTQNVLAVEPVEIVSGARLSDEVLAAREEDWR